MGRAKNSISDIWCEAVKIVREDRHAAGSQISTQNWLVTQGVAGPGLVVFAVEVECYFANDLWRWRRRAKRRPVPFHVVAVHETKAGQRLLVVRKKRCGNLT